MRDCFCWIVIGCTLIWLSNIRAQSYMPFHLDGAKWTMERVTPVFGAGDGHSYWEIFTLDDTLIQDNVYRKIAVRNLCALWPDLQGNLHYQSGIVTLPVVLGGIREENKKVYFLRFDQSPPWGLLEKGFYGLIANTDHLLYDFDILPGDTVFFTGADNFTIVVDSVETTSGYKRYLVKNSSAFYFPVETGFLTEGYGSSYGLFGSYDSWLTILHCFTLEGDSIQTSQCNFCEGFVATEEPDEQNAIRVYPNPVIDRLFVETSTNESIHQVSFLTCSGHTMETFISPGAIFEIDLADYPAGLYFVLIQFENGYRGVMKVIISGT